MTVKELIEKLQEMPPDMEVRYEDYENADCEIDKVEMRLDGCWVDGPYVSLS